MSNEILGVFDIGQNFDSWRLIEEIRPGGQGAIIRAADRRTNETVAIKVALKRHPDDTRYFDREREVLQHLQVSGVVALCGSGVYREQLPYLVLKFVNGVGLDHFADDRKLPIPDRCQLVVRACEIVAAVHSQGVVHCDLKPSNFLVTQGGELWLIDLGSAFIRGSSALGVNAADHPGTEPYMSPEQVRGEALDERTDVYSLGVTLYELLCSHLPFGQARSVREAILGEEPQRPSDAVFRSGRVCGDGDLHPMDPEIVARTRNTTPDELAAILRRGLDDIVLTALQKNPDRRHSSVSELVRGLKGWLETV